MKPKSTLRSFLALAGSSLLAISYTQAATQYWSADGVAQGGATGTWSTSFWGDAATGPFASPWVDTNTAVFGGTAGTVSLTADVTVGGQRFNTSAYILASDSATSKTLNFASGDNTILLNNIAAASTSSGAAAGLKLGGTGNVILSTTAPATASTLTLNYAVAGLHSIGWSGTTTINPGMTLALTGRDLSLSSTTGITLNGGGITLTNGNSTQGTFDRVSNAGITSNGGTISYNNSSGSTYTETIGTVDLVRSQANFVLSTSMATGSQILTLTGLTRTGAANTSSVAFAAGGGLNATTSQIVVSGKTAGFIGPWATCGTAITGGSLSDYAVYNGSAQVVPANITATPENDPSWIAGANVTLSAATTLTGTRTVNTLRYTGGTGNVDLGTNSLETYGFLSGGSGAPTITNGTLTTPSGGGNLYLALSRNMTVSAPINDNGGAVTVVQTGVGQLTLSSTTSNFSGGIVLNAGTLVTTADTNLGATSNAITVNGTVSWNGGAVIYARDVTINEGAVLSMTGTVSQFTISGVVAGSGTLRNFGNNNQYNLTNTGNTFTGILYNDYMMQVASIGDSSKPINLSGSNSEFRWTGGTKDFALRPFTLQTVGGVQSGQISNSGTGPLTVQQDLAISGAAGARAFSLGGTYTGAANTFSGKIANGTDGTGSVVSLTKKDAGTWSLTNTANSYTGATTVTGGVLQVSSLAAGVNLGAATGVGGLILNGGTLRYTGGLVSTTRNFALTASSSIDASGSDAVNFSQTGAVSPDQTLNATFATGQKVVTGLSSTADLVVGMRVTGNGIAASSTIASINSSSQITLNNNTTLAGTDEPLSFGYTASARTLTLTGTNTGANTISGILQNTTAVTTGVLNLTKAGTGTWVLSNANTYTGTTTAGGGILKLNNATALPGGTADTGGTSGLTITGGGVVGLTANSGNFLRARGTTAEQVQWTGVGGGGFAAYGGDRTVNLGGAGGTAQWATGSFVPSNHPLILSAADADGTLIWANPINFAGGVRVIQVNNGSAAVDARLTATLGVSGGTNGSLDKTGAGTLETTATNLYVGNTTVSEGTLRLGASDVLPNTTNVTIAAATLDVGAGFTDTVGTLDVTAAATINLGDSSSKLVFADSNGVDWTLPTAGTLNITGAFVSGSSIKFATSGGLSAGQLASIKLNGAPASFSLDGSGFLVSGGGPVGFAAWQAANGTLGDRSDDHDNDGVDNGTEHFIYGTVANSGFTALPGVGKALDGTLSITWTKAGTYTGSYPTHYVVETSATLAAPWAPIATSGTPNVANTVHISGNNVTYTFPAGTKNFARLKVTGP